MVRYDRRKNVRTASQGRRHAPNAGTLPTLEKQAAHMRRIFRESKIDSFWTAEATTWPEIETSTGEWHAS